MNRLAYATCIIVTLFTTLPAVGSISAQQLDSSPVASPAVRAASCRGTPRDAEQVLARILDIEANGLPFSTASGTVVADFRAYEPLNITVDGRPWVVDSRLATGDAESLPPTADPAVLPAIQTTLRMLQACDNILEHLYAMSYYTDAGMEQNLRFLPFLLKERRLVLEQYPPLDDGKDDIATWAIFDARAVADGRVAAIITLSETGYLGEARILPLAMVFKFEDGIWKVDWQFTIGGNWAEETP